jgi:NAD(P)-dependent dehydrogenase (short-subunit alcohol dehydrogenase family)
MSKSVSELFRLDGRVAVITGGGGMLGMKHAEAIAEVGGTPVLLDVNESKVKKGVAELRERFGPGPSGHAVDITELAAVRQVVGSIVGEKGHIDILINNAAMTVESSLREQGYFAPFEEYDVGLWERALRVSLTGAFICTQAVGRHMKDRRSGVVLNIASDVGVISPDHRIYRPDPKDDYPGTPFNTPLSYAVAKAGLINFTRYLATYWAPYNIRVNALSPAGVYNDHDERFVRRLTNLIPMGRMATKDEYKGAVVFLVSDASAFMTGFNVIMDGGRTCW